MPDAATLLPPNVTTLESVAAQLTGRVDTLPTPLRDLWDPAACPAGALSWLAYAFGVEDWSVEWTEAQRRAVITKSIPVKRHRGTVGAVQAAINALGVTGRVQEWHRQIPAGAPFTYRLLLQVDQTGYTLAQLDQLVQIVERAKNLRSHLDTIIPSALSRSRLVVATVVSTGSQVDVTSGTPVYSDGTPALDLLIDAAVNGEASTLSAIDALHTSLHTTMPANNYW